MQASNKNSDADLFRWSQDGYHCYYNGGNRGDCRHALFTEAYEAWHSGYSQAEAEDIE